MIKIATRYPIPETIKKITLNVRYEEYIRNVQNIYIYFFIMQVSFQHSRMSSFGAKKLETAHNEKSPFFLHLPDTFLAHNIAIVSHRTLRIIPNNYKSSSTRV